MRSAEIERLPKAGFEELTDNAKGAIVKARMEATAYDSMWIEPNHLLLGILSNQKCSVAQKLTKLGLDFEKIRQEVEKVEVSLNRPTPSCLPKEVYAVELADLLDDSLDSARMDGLSLIDTNYLLLGLCRWAKDDPNFVLKKFLDFNLD